MFKTWGQAATICCAIGLRAVQRLRTNGATRTAFSRIALCAARWLVGARVPRNCAIDSFARLKNASHIVTEPLTDSKTGSELSLPERLAAELDVVRRRLRDIESSTQATTASCMALLDAIQQLAAEAYQESAAAFEAEPFQGPRRSRKLPEIAQLAARASLLCQSLLQPNQNV